jgi:hypothetical protein
MRLFFNVEEVSDVASLLGRFGKDAFASPYRSTVPLVALVKDDWAVFEAIATSCGAGEHLSVHFEYRVEVPGVLGNPSQRTQW